MSGDFETGRTQREETAGGTGKSTDLAISIQGNTIDRDAKQNGSGVSVGVAHTLNSVDRHGIAIPINTMVATKTAPETRTTFGVGEDGDPQFTLQAAHSHAVCAGFSFGQSEKARSIGYQQEVSPTLRGGEGGNQKPCALCIGNGQANQSVSDKAGALNTMHDQQAVMVLNDQGGSVMDVSQGTTATLRAQSHGHEPAVVVAAVDCRNGRENTDVNGTLQAKSNGGTSYNLNNVCRCDSVVRRLTPLECERLQGYPDGWTDIGEWTDSKGKKHKPADSPRYKALGNSIALPFWFWLLRRISAQYYRPATLGSLFDGISGFCYVWARCNGSKSCLWASEIEEFPIAVCKRHFGDEESGEVGDVLEYL